MLHALLAILAPSNDHSSSFRAHLYMRGTFGLPLAGWLRYRPLWYAAKLLQLGQQLSPALFN